MAATVVLVIIIMVISFSKTLQQNKVISLKVSITSFHNKPLLYSNIFKRRLAHDSPLVQ